MADLPNGAAERQQMLEAIGAASVEDLFASVPARLRHPRLNLPPPLAEQDLVTELERLAARNHPLGELDSFLGAGVDPTRHVPAIVRAAVARPEFYTAYTPYQAEASQGTLQTIFEFQSMICALTGLEVANASLYDGASAAAEAVMMAVAQTGRHRVVAEADLNPETLSVIRTYARGREVEVVTADGIGHAVGPEDACAVVAQPGFLGTVDDLLPVAEAARAAGAISICCADPIACALLVPPGELGFDIAVGDGQPLGIAPSFGGPHVGFMAVRQELMRRMPGRLVRPRPRPPRPARLRAHAPGSRAAHPAREGDLQHLHQPRPDRAGCDRLHGQDGGGRDAPGGRGQRPARPPPRRPPHRGWTGSSSPSRTVPTSGSSPSGCPATRATSRRRCGVSGIVAGLPLGRVDPRRADQLLVCCTETTTPASIDRYVAAAARVAEPAGVGA